jgi:sulfatase maturation enzyme AslB (radical SAM superfamily)
MWYCPLPFKNVFVDTQGVSVCCNIPRQPVDLETWQTHPKLLSLQQNFLQGNIPKECGGCISQENTQGRSLRTDSNKDYNYEIFTKTDINFIDYRASNICNFKCRSCSPTFSHGIDQEAKKIPELQKFYKINPTKTVSVSDSNKSWIINHLDQIDRLMFTGGEPTLIPETKQLLEQIIRTHADKISVLITTNASFEDTFWFDLVERIPNLHWTVSIDAVGPAAHVIRHGTNWDKVESNVRWLAKHANSLDINTVVSSLNLFQLKPLLEFCRKIQLMSISPNGRQGSNGCRHQFLIVNNPQLLSAVNWPNELKQQAQRYLQECLEIDLDQEQKNMIQSLIGTLQTLVFNSMLWDKTQQYNLLLDSARSENHFELFDNKYSHGTT